MKPPKPGSSIVPKGHPEPSTRSLPIRMRPWMPVPVPSTIACSRSMPTPSASKGLATRWQSSEDGLSIPPNPAQGSDLPPYPWFSPTRHFNADDVLFTWQRLLDEHHPLPRRLRRRVPLFYSLGLGNLIKRVYKKGPHEVVFELNRPDASFLATLASDYAIVLSAEYGEQMLKAGTRRCWTAAPSAPAPSASRSIATTSSCATCVTPATGAARPEWSSSSTTSRPNPPSALPSC